MGAFLLIKFARYLIHCNLYVVVDTRVSGFNLYLGVDTSMSGFKIYVSVLTQVCRIVT